MSYNLSSPMSSRTSGRIVSHIVTFNLTIPVSTGLNTAESINMEKVVFDLQFLFGEKNSVSHCDLLLLRGHPFVLFLPRSVSSSLGRGAVSCERKHSKHVRSSELHPNTCLRAARRSLGRVAKRPPYRPRRASGLCEVWVGTSAHTCVPPTIMSGFQLVTWGFQLVPSSPTTTRSIHLNRGALLSAITFS
ncbi:hypothetical protein KSP40_PGU001921 [Platanthera guangdongensis]|uniref:Uncharacterized protein n=1 Tax=Platanthera guangdongensis TaxID=2320717 RepID=A0ABR2M071_9ASPA